jgi:5-methylcytosine-specific restriction endonuclease McrA
MYTCGACQRVEVGHRLQAHHIIAHRGDPKLFFDLNNLQTLCVECHPDVEHWGYRTELDRDGYPVDPAHPFNRS